MKNITNIIAEMKKNNGLIGLKMSFEDEGVSIDDCYDITRESAKNNLQTTVKIGGCDAKSDIMRCLFLEIDNIVAPMVETPYAFKKFRNLTNQVCGVSNSQFYVNIETQTAIKNLNDILEINENFLQGIVIGRSDVVGSMGLSKDRVDSLEVYTLVERALFEAKKRGLTTTIGGNISINSREFIESLYNKNILDRIETRLVVCELSKPIIENFSNLIDNAIELEKMFLNKRIQRLEKTSSFWKKRVVSIGKRTQFLQEVATNEKNTLVLDFDNVIHMMDKGFHDGTIYGDPLPFCKESLKQLSKTYDLVVYSCKCNPNRPLVDGRTGTELIKEWLTQHDLLKYIKDVTFDKPNAVAYIDDKGIRFNDWKSCIKQLKELGLI